MVECSDIVRWSGPESQKSSPAGPVLGRSERNLGFAGLDSRAGPNTTRTVEEREAVARSSELPMKTPATTFGLALRTCVKTRRQAKSPSEPRIARAKDNKVANLVVMRNFHLTFKSSRA